MNKCPKCKSSKVRQVSYRGVSCIVCSDCSYDERNLYEQGVGERSSQKAKAQFSPYKAGGKQRTSSK